MLVIFCMFEMLKYCLAEYICFGKKVKNKIPIIAGILLYFIFAIFSRYSFEFKYLVIYIVTLVSIYFTIHDNLKNRVQNLSVIFFIMTSLSGIVLFIYDFYFSTRLRIDSVNIAYAIQDSMCLLFLFVTIIIKINLKEETIVKIQKNIHRNIIFLIVITTLIITFAISLLSYSKAFIANNLYKNLAIFIGGVSYISIGFLGVIAIYIKFNNDRINELVKNEILQKEMQKRYYETLLEQDKRTRAYRHDMSNHLVCLNSYAQMEDLESLKSYLRQLHGEMIEINSKCYRTGNDILDIMTNFYLPQLSQNIQVIVKGINNILIDEMKLCTIYSNLLQNAVEELSSDKKKNGFLHIFFLQNKSFIRICIENSIFRKVDPLGKFVTKKGDKINHGIGLKNVKGVVESLGGKIIIENNNDIFKVLVELNIKNDR